MKKRILIFTINALLAASLLAGCGSANTEVVKEASETVTEVMTEAASETAAANTLKIDLEDGQYIVDFETDSTMFHVNEEYDDKATMTVKDGQAVVHIVLESTHIVNLYLGTAEEAQKEGSLLLEPTVEEVEYSDGTTDEANAFDVPVPAIEEEFDLALIGTKGTWYDHKVKVTNVTPAVNVSLEGGSGRASIESPAPITRTEDGYVVTVKWSSPYYDYMIVDGTKYLPINTEGNSVFEISIDSISEPVSVIADTTAMSKPYEIEYTISFN